MQELQNVHLKSGKKYQDLVKKYLNNIDIALAQNNETKKYLKITWSKKN